MMIWQIMPRKLRLLDKIRPFIAENESFSDDYLKLVIENETEQCMSIVLGIFNGSGVESSFIKPELMDVIYAVIIDELQMHISSRIQSEMLEMIDVFEKGDT